MTSALSGMVNQTAGCLLGGTVLDADRDVVVAWLDARPQHA